MTKHRWQSYVYVKAYHLEMGHFEHKCRTEMQRAAMDDAPITAIHKEDGAWRTLSDLPEPFQQIVKSHEKETT